MLKKKNIKKKIQKIVTKKEGRENSKESGSCSYQESEARELAGCRLPATPTQPSCSLSNTNITVAVCPETASAAGALQRKEARVSPGPPSQPPRNQLGGEGDWQLPTERRAAPKNIAVIS